MASGPHIRDTLPPTPADGLLAPFRAFMAFPAAPGILLLACASVAMLWANSPLAASYDTLFNTTTFTIGVGDAALTKPLVVWINDLLMAAFFFLVGLEIKRELIVGELADLKRAAVPVIAAVGGMAVPGALYALFNTGHGGSHGWGIPTATDIAFALGVMALLGKRVPPALRLFLTTLAIADDLGALLVIAVFYTDDLHLSYLGYGLIVLATMHLLNFLGVRRLIPYILLALVLWFFILKSGVHSTIAGVLASTAISLSTRVTPSRFAEFVRSTLDPHAEHADPCAPARAADAIHEACDAVQSPLHIAEHALAPWVNFLILPVFALANAGVNLSGGLPSDASSVRISLGVVIGLVLGKPLGITLASWLAVKSGTGALPRGCSWAHVHAAAWLGGIGFTMSLFIATLAFVGDAGHVEQDIAAAKLGILGASVLAAGVGLALLALACKPAPARRG